jgi:hypothetical protein
LVKKLKQYFQGDKIRLPELEASLPKLPRTSDLFEMVGGLLADLDMKDEVFEPENETEIAQ